MADVYNKMVTGPDGPYVDAFAITPSNSVIFLQTTSAIYVGSAGNVAVQMSNKAQTNTNIIFSAVPAGTTLRVRAHMVLASNTTASALVGLV